MLRGALFGFKELAPGVGSAGGQGDAAFAALDEGWIVAVAVAMHGSSKTSGDDMVEALGATATLPDQGHVGSGSFAGPEVSLFGLAIAGTQVLNRCLPSLRSTPPGQPEAGCLAPFGSDRSVISHSPALSQQNTGLRRPPLRDGCLPVPSTQTNQGRILHAHRLRELRARQTAALKLHDHRRALLRRRAHPPADIPLH